MSHDANKPTTYTLTLRRSTDEPRLRRLAQAMSRKSGVEVGPTQAFRFALGHAERLLGLDKDQAPPDEGPA